MKFHFSATKHVIQWGLIPIVGVTLILTPFAPGALAVLEDGNSKLSTPAASSSFAGCMASLVDIATDATDPSNLGDTEPSIAVNPVNPMEISVVSFSEGWSGTAHGPVWKSNDGGATWRKVLQLPRPSPSSGGPGDQKIAYDRLGRLYVVELAGGVAPPRCLVYSQTGLPDTPLTLGAFFGDDQPHLDLDNLSAGACAGTLYSPWLNFGVSLERSTVTNSVTGGAAVVNVGAGDNSASENRTTRLAVAPNGRSYIIYKKRQGATSGGFEKAEFTVNRSDDCGATWNAIGGAAGVRIHSAATVETWFTTSWGNSAKGKVARARSSDAWIAADPGDGDIFGAYVSKDSSTFGQIYVARSTDQGLNWTSTRVTDGTHHSAYPEIAVTSSGAVGVLYIDYDDSGANTIFRHRFAFSTNNGTTWTDQILQSMDPGPLANASSGFLWGDYEGLTANGNTFYGVFTGRSIGRTTAQLDPIFFRVTVRPEIQAPASVAFSDTCVGVTDTKTLKVCNNGCTNLVVTGITSSNPTQFSIAPPAGGFPVTITPGACFDFQARFTPTSAGPKTATYTIASNDAASASAGVSAGGLARQLQSITCPPDITVVAAAPGMNSVLVTYSPPTVVDSSCAVSVVCTPPSNTNFPLGTTTVTCTATDAANNSVSCSFKVIAFDVCIQDDQHGDFLLFNSFTGEYSFTKCGVDGFTMAGKGSITRVGCSTKLDDDTRILSAEVVRCPHGTENRGSARIKRIVPGTTFVLHDSYILNNTCTCP